MDCCPNCGMQNCGSKRCESCGIYLSNTSDMSPRSTESHNQSHCNSPIESEPHPLDPQIAFIHVSQGRNMITCQELQVALDLTGLQISIDVCNQFVMKYDTDNNGGIDFHEFGNIINELKEWINVFAYFDEDKSGQLDYSEFISSLVKMNYSFPDSLVRLIFNNFDHDHTGVIQFDDFIKVCSVIQIIKSKIRMYHGSENSVTLNFDQLLDIVFSIPM